MLKTEVTNSQSLFAFTYLHRVSKHDFSASLQPCTNHYWITSISPRKITTIVQSFLCGPARWTIVSWVDIFDWKRVVYHGTFLWSRRWDDMVLQTGLVEGPRLFLAWMTNETLATFQTFYLIQLHQLSRALYSSTQQLLQVPYMSTDFCWRAFSYRSPATGNSIPTSIKNCSSLVSPHCPAH